MVALDPQVLGRALLDLPEPNRAAIALAERLGPASILETSRMNSGFTPEIDLRRVFGLTTLELG